MTIQKNISLKEFNTFHVEASAKYFCEINDINELESVITDSRFRNEQKLILGGGSNLLFTKDFNGIVIKNNIGGIELLSEDEESVIIKVGAGNNWDEFVEYTVSSGFNGLENLSLIPGTVGASPIQNIGAYGVEVKDVIKSVNGFSLDNYEMRTFSNSECKFGYRDSIFKNELRNKFIVTSVVFNLSENRKVKSNYEAIKNYFSEKNITEITPSEIRKAVIEIRKSKLPDPREIGNAGSFFKNPIISEENFEKIKSDYPDLNGYKVDDNSVKISAGWLIEKCGLKGRRIKDVGIYDKQALVIVNYGNASGMEIKNLAEEIRDIVLDKFNISLRFEVNIL
ncbi:MAG: UDP-N-acetylmuramate dehydrogenase [Chlorobi bacterium]|nr:UDP-N-acetylmuramate dehydrogenase [Chlorobiota bacterium]